jgi:hypothetical protein
VSSPHNWIHPEDVQVILNFLAYLNEHHPVGGESPLWYSSGRIEIVSPEERTLLGYAQPHDDTWGFIPINGMIGFVKS